MFLQKLEEKVEYILEIVWIFDIGALPFGIFQERPHQHLPVQKCAMC